MILRNKFLFTCLALVLSFVCVSSVYAVEREFSIYETMLIDGTRTAYAGWTGDPDARDKIKVERDWSRTDGVVWQVDLTDSGHKVGNFSTWVYSWEDIHRPGLYNNLYVNDMEHLTFESEWPVGTGNNIDFGYPDGFPNGVSFTVGGDYNGDSVFARIVKTGLPVDECAAGFTNAYELGNWEAGSITGGSTWITPDSGPAGSAIFSYDVNLGSPGGGVSYRTATFKTAAFGTGTFTFDYDYSGYHAIFNAYVDFMFFADGPNGTETIILVDYVKTSGTYNFTGTASIDIYHGYEFGFIVGGRNFDSNSRLLGNLEISNVNGDADSDTVADGCDVCDGGDDTIDDDNDGIPDECDACPLAGDNNCDNKVDLQDLAILAGNWLVGVVEVP